MNNSIISSLPSNFAPSSKTMIMRNALPIVFIKRTQFKIIKFKINYRIFAATFPRFSKLKVTSLPRYEINL